jgi:hypothetical protein
MVKVIKTSISINKLNIEAHACDPSYVKGHSSRIMTQASRGKRCETLPEKYLKAKRTGKHGGSGRKPA